MKNEKALDLYSFNVIILDFNKNTFVSYDVIPYFVSEYKEAKKKPVTLGEFREFVEDHSRYQFWGRCEYEVVLHSWPCDDVETKIDVHDQIMRNLDLVVYILMNSVKK